MSENHRHPGTRSCSVWAWLRTAYGWSPCSAGRRRWPSAWSWAVRWENGLPGGLTSGWAGAPRLRVWILRGPVCGRVCRALGTRVRRAPCGGVCRALGGRVCCAARRGRGRGAGGQAVRPHGRAGRAQHQGRQNACGNFLFHHQHPPIGLLARRRAAHPSPAMFAPAHGESPCGRGAKGAARPVRRWQSTLSI